MENVGDMRIMLYHGVRPNNDTTSPDIRKKHVPVETFKRHLRIYQTYFTPISLATVVSSLAEKRALPKNGICITFDDGYANNAEVAAPLLKAAGIPATFFVTTGFIDQTTRLWVDRFEMAFSALKHPKTTDAEMRHSLKKMSVEDRERAIQDLEAQTHTTGITAPLHRAMTWDQIRTLAQDGFEIGAHTVTHPILSRLAPNEMTREIRESKQRIEQEIRRPCTSFAFPNGQPDDWTPVTLETIKQAGFTSCLTTVDGSIQKNDDPYTLKRITVDTGSDYFKFLLTVSGLRSTLSRLRASLHV